MSWEFMLTEKQIVDKNIKRFIKAGQGPRLAKRHAVLLYKSSNMRRPPK